MRPHVKRGAVVFVIMASLAVACGDDASTPPVAQGPDAAVPPISPLPVPDASTPVDASDASKPQVSLAVSILGADLVPSETDLDSDLAFPEEGVFPADLLPPF